MSRTKTKRYLVLLAAVGLIAAGLGGSGTFASFNAQVANNGNYFATGTLFLHDKGPAGTTCTSESDTGNDNTSTSNTCDFLFQIPAVTPGTTYPAALTLTNAGSLDAQDIKFALRSACQDVKPVIATLPTGFSSGTTSFTTLTLSGLAHPLLAGTKITVTDSSGSPSEDFTVVSTSGQVVTVQSVTTTATIGNNANVTLAAFGTGSLCSGLQFTITETQADHSTDVGCAYGTVSAVVHCAPDSSHSLAAIGSDLNNTSGPSSNTLSLASGTGNTNAIDAGNSRYFRIDVKAPSTLSNASQNTQVKFDVLWHIDQTP